MNKAIKFMTMIPLILISASTLNAEDCANANDTVSIVECLDQRYVKADKNLNDVYKEIMKELPDSEKQKLRQAQREWLKYRDASYALAIEINKDNRSYGTISFLDYKAKLVEKRVMELKYLFSGPEDSPVEW